jgi:hypothetical protein
MTNISNFLVRLAGLITLAWGASLHAYTFESHAWAIGTVASPTLVTMQLQLQQASPVAPAAPAIATTLQDGSTSWNQVALAALTDWNQYLSTLKFVGANNSALPIPSSSSASNHNNVFWDGSVYGDSWGLAGGDAVGITIIWTTTITPSNGPSTTFVTETDVLFNTNVTWDSYRGQLQGNTSDLRRVALHEFGHVLGLNHPDLATPPQSVAAIMNSVTSATDDLTVDDIAGAEYLYGAPGLVQVTTSPVSQTVSQGNAATFSVVVTGLGPITYQWRKNGAAITGATSATLALANVQPSDAATYTVTATNGSGPVTTATGGVLTVTLATAPAFTSSPVSQVIASGHSVAFLVTVTGVPAPSLQWKRNGVAIPGATDQILLVSGATSAANAGSYTCTATNASATVASSPATLSVVTTSNPGYLANISARGFVGTGGGILIGGLGLTGNGSSTKQLLIRGIGPGLYATFPTFFSSSSVVPDPQLVLYSGNNPLQTSGGVTIQNNNWGSPAYPGAATATALSTAYSTLGAYSLASNSLDAALLVTLVFNGAGSITAQVSDVNQNTGTGVVEVYDYDTNAPTVRLTNLSARDLVETGQNILIGGFSISGSTAETVLIRAMGPGLTQVFQLPGTLAQPVLTLVDSKGNVVESNTGWGGDPTLTAAEAVVGAYAVSSSSQDSFLLVTLNPGSYTAEITGVNNSTGIATVEIYEVY